MNNWTPLMALDDKLRELRQKKELPDNVITFYFPKEDAVGDAPKIGAVIDSGHKTRLVRDGKNPVRR